MVLQTKVGAFTKSAVAAPPAFQQSITGLGFQPKAIVFYTVATQSGATEEHRPSFGFSDGINSRAIGWASADNASPTGASMTASDQGVIEQITPGGSKTVTIDIVSFDADGFTIEYVLNNTADFEIFYIAFGGDDITNIKVGGFDTPPVAGNQDITTVGFAPDMVMFLNAHALVNTIGDHSMAFLGVGISSAKQYALGWSAEDGRTAAQSARLQRTDRCICMFSHVDNSIIEGDASYLQPLTNGFRLSWNTVAGVIEGEVAHPIFYLAIKGGGWNVGSFTQPVTTGNQIVTTQGGVTPKMVMLSSIGSTEQLNMESSERMFIGAAESATSRHSIWGAVADQSNPTIVARGRVLDRCMRFLSENAVAADSVLNAEADFVSFGSSQFTINWLTADAVPRHIVYLVAGDKPAVTTVTKSTTFRYNNQKTVTKSVGFKYHVGGEVVAGPFTQRYHVLAKVRKSTRMNYGIQNFMQKTSTFKYTIGPPTSLLQKTSTFSYGIANIMRKSSRHIYSVDEDPSTNSLGYGKPLRPRIYIMDPSGNEVYHSFDAFKPEESDIRVNYVDVTVAQGQAGDFTIRVEDAARRIDPSVVGEGNMVLIQAAKSDSALNDGRHDLMLGYIRTKNVIRRDTGTLEYEFTGAGASIRLNERITTFNYAARRLAYNNTVADQNDSSMYAMNLVKKLIESTEHLPLGTPLEDQFTIKGVMEREPIVKDFVPAIEEELTEWSNILDIISDTTGAGWGTSIVDRRPDIYLRYPTLEHSGITIKDKVALTDDRYRTAYLVGPWNFEDSTRKEDGFTNRFFARSGSKSVSTNVVSITNISDEYTPLVINVPSTGGSTTTPGTGGTTSTVQADIGTIVPLYTYPTSDTWISVANVARQFPRVKFVVIINPSSGPGGSQDQNYVTGIRNLQSAGITVLGYVATGYTAKSEGNVQAEVDKYINWYVVDGIFWDEMSNDTAHVGYYSSITNYCKTTKGLRYVCGNPGAATPEAFFSGTSMDNILIYENVGLPSVSSLSQPWFSTHPRARRGVIPYGVTSASETTIRTFTRDCVEQNVAGMVYIQNDSGSNPWDTLSGYYATMVQELDIIAAEITQTPEEPAPTTPDQPEAPVVPAPRDLCQSFIPNSSRLTDLVLILSRVGDPRYHDTNIGIGTPEASIIQPNSVHGHVETNKVVSQITVVDPTTGAETTREINMPSGNAIAYFNIPFSTINAQIPTACFLNDIVYRQNDIVPGQRYWVVVYGRGQDESNTIRWHHSDNPQFEMLSGERIPGGHGVSQEWTIFDNAQKPAFGMSFFDTTLQFTEASDPDSIEQFKLVESTIDVSFINEEELIAKFLQTLLYYASKPKRIYEINAVTAPDELILPGFLVNIIDEMSTHQYGGSSTEAEILEAHYAFSADTEGLGTRYVDVKPLGYVDFAFAKWKRKLERGEITIPQEGDPVIIQPPAGAGPQPPPPQCPIGHHWDEGLQMCVPDATVPPPTNPTSPTPADLRPPVRIFVVSTVTDLTSAIINARPGDEIVVKNGTYSISARTFLNKAGTVANPITIRAEFVGGVIFTGGGGWKFDTCSNINWYGFNHRHTADGEAPLLFIGCTNCRFARCDVQLSGATRSHWLSIDGGTGNRVDHNIFHDKNSEGHFLFVGRNGMETVGTIVEYNYFRGHRFSGTTGIGEAMGVGTSVSSNIFFNSVIRYNLFQDCTGDTSQVLSNRSCGNLYYRNAFIGCRGSLVCRHGRGTRILCNYFDGNCGVRLHGRDNVVARNCFTNHSGSDGINVPIYVGMGTVESAPAGAHPGYERVLNNTIVLNTIHNGSAQTTDPMVLWGGPTGAGTLLPNGCVFRGNVVQSSTGMLFQFRNGTDADNDFGNNDNIFWVTGSAVFGDLPNTHWEQFNPMLGRGSDGIYRIVTLPSEAHNEFAAGTFAGIINEDLDGESSVGDTVDAGSDQYSTTAPPVRRVTPTDVGPAGAITTANPTLPS